MSDKKYSITIDICGTNSVLGTLLASPEFSYIIKADGLKGLRKILEEEGSYIGVICPEKEEEEVTKQFEELKIEKFIINPKPVW